jgi:UDP-N-acetylglucosamine:LPS N-acetylglucosamine transferase
MTATETMTMPLATEDATDPLSSPKQEEIEATEASVEATTSAIITTEPETGNSKALKILFLSSDTGGGHRASAESLAGQFEILYPGSTYHLLDLATESYLPPYNSIVSYYKHLSNHPSQWKLLYGVTNSKFMERAVDTNIKVMTVVCERGIRKKIKSLEPDVVVSVHPLQTSVPILSCAKISHETGKHLPMFTVVTDLGSAHSTWFANGVEKMFVGSTQIYDLAKKRGKVPAEKLVLVGLPIRNDFALESEKLGFRMGPDGKEYQEKVKTKLGLPAVDRKTLLVMGGGEGVGSLANIVDALYCELAKQGIDAVIMVVCGRNEKLKKGLEERDWAEVFQKRSTKQKDKKSKRRSLFPPLFGDLSGCGEDSIATAGCIEAGGMTKSLRRILSSGSLLSTDSAVFIPSPTKAIENEPKKEEKKEVVNRKTLGFKSMSIGPIEMHAITSADEGEASVPAGAVEEATAAEEAAVTAETAIRTEEIKSSILGKVDVVGLGFVTNMAEYMVAADILVSKAGPGTISEAAALSLPIMLTSFLPGQEAGNVDYVVEGGFGAYCQDTDPQNVAEEVAQWLNDEEKMTMMSAAAKRKGAPYAARDIVRMIGDSTLKWRVHNEAQGAPVEQQAPSKKEERAPSVTEEPSNSI